MLTVLECAVQLIHLTIFSFSSDYHAVCMLHCVILLVCLSFVQIYNNMNFTLCEEFALTNQI